MFFSFFSLLLFGLLFMLLFGVAMFVLHFVPTANENWTERKAQQSGMKRKQGMAARPHRR